MRGCPSEHSTYLTDSARARRRLLAAAPDRRMDACGLRRSRCCRCLDPAHLRRNAVPPPVHVEQIVADRKIYPAAGVVRLPPLTRDLEIDYVGLSFVAPQRVRFRYRLEGRDDDLAGTGDAASGVLQRSRPGHVSVPRDREQQRRRLERGRRVARDCHRTGVVPDPDLFGAEHPGRWPGGVAYRLRMQQVARALNARFDERLAERTRMARDLHDTLLQTVQGSKMVADTALDRPDDAPALGRALQQVSAWLGQAGEEGRATVNALRTSTTESNDLAEAFRRAVEDCQRQGAIAASLTVTGDAREMHPVVRDELYRIGYEAIRNARTHSRGSRLDIALSYGHDLTLRVADDGVGMELTMAEHGKEGHFGLRGMRERAARIGATLSVTSAPGTGTAIVVTVPGRVIFRKASTGLAARIRSMLSGTDETPTLH